MLLGTEEDPCRRATPRRPWAPSYSEALTGIQSFYRLVVELLGKELTSELRGALLLVLRRVGEVGLGIEGLTTYAGKDGGGGPGDSPMHRRDSSLSAVREMGLSSVDNASDDASSRVMGR